MRLYRITIAANNVAAMHRFYSDALGAALGHAEYNALALILAFRVDVHTAAKMTFSSVVPWNSSC